MLFDGIQLLDQVKHLLEAIVHELSALCHEFFITNEYLIVGLHVLNSVREGILSLTCQVSNAAVQYTKLDGVACFRSTPLFFLDEVQDAFHDLEEGVLRITWNDDEEAQYGLQELTHSIEVFDVVNLDLLAQWCYALSILGEAFIHGWQDSLQEGIWNTNQSVEQRCLSCEQEQFALMFWALKSWNGNVSIGNTRFYEGLCFWVMLTIRDFMGFISKTNDLVDECLSHQIKIDEQAPCCGEHIQRLVQVSAEVDLPNDVSDDTWYSFFLWLRTQSINLVMECFCDLEDGVDHEAILQFLVVLHEESKHHLTEFVLYARGEVVKEREEILEAYELGEIFGCHHDLDK